MQYDELIAGNTANSGVFLAAPSSVRQLFVNHRKVKQQQSRNKHTKYDTVICICWEPYEILHMLLYGKWMIRLRLDSTFSIDWLQVHEYCVSLSVLLF